jgi:hypothetical protein
VVSQWRAGSGVSSHCNHFFVAVIVAVLGGMVILTAYPAEPPAEAAPQIVCKLELNLEPHEKVDPQLPPEKIPPGYRTQADMIRAALADAKGLPEDVRRELHYLSLHDIPFADRAEFIQVLTYHLNELSRKADLVPPRVVTPDGSLVAFLDTDYGYKTVGKLGQFDRFWHEKATISAKGKKDVDQIIQSTKLPQKELAELSILTNSSAPILNADWFFVNTARQISVFNGQDENVGYTSFLQINSRADLEKLIKFNDKDSIEIGADQAAALDKSGIAIYMRKIEIKKALTGRIYKTLDTNNPTGRGNVKNNLKRGEFLHLAEEEISFLPNGLPVWYLNNANGERQTSAPDFIGHVESILHQGNDGRIHVGPLSCGECHMTGNNAVLRPIDDWVRNNISGPLALGAVKKEDFDELKRQYFSVLDTQLQADRLLFSAKVFEVCGMNPPDLQKAYSKWFYRYALTDYRPAEIAALLGVEQDVLVNALKGYNKEHGFVPLVALSPLLKDKPGSMRIEEVEEAFPLLQGLMQQYKK